MSSRDTRTQSLSLVVPSGGAELDHRVLALRGKLADLKVRQDQAFSLMAKTSAVDYVAKKLDDLEKERTSVEAEIRTAETERAGLDASRHDLDEIRPLIERLQRADEDAPRLRSLASAGWVRPLREVLPAVTCTAQATLLTGQPPAVHGAVANGWLFRETGEVRFWQQSNRLLDAEPLYVTARRRAASRGQTFRCAKLFWWFNQGAAVDVSVTPKPYWLRVLGAVTCTGRPLMRRPKRVSRIALAPPGAGEEWQATQETLL